MQMQNIRQNTWAMWICMQLHATPYSWTDQISFNFRLVALQFIVDGERNEHRWDLMEDVGHYSKLVQCWFACQATQSDINVSRCVIPKPRILHHGFHKYNLQLDMVHPEPNAKNNWQSTSSESVVSRSSAKSGVCMYVCKWCMQCMYVCVYACMFVCNVMTCNVMYVCMWCV